jgi:hypothetical protein
MERVSAVMEASASAAVFGCSAGRSVLDIIWRNPDRDIAASADKLARLGCTAGRLGAGNKGNRKP